MLFLRADGMKKCVSKKSTNILGAADSFYEIENAAGIVVATSAVLYNDKTPKWAPIKVNMEDLCNHDEDQQVTLKFYDYESSGNHDLIGTVVTSAKGMKESAKEYRNQPHVTLADSKASHEFGEWVRLFIYDVITITGAPVIVVAPLLSHDDSVVVKVETSVKVEAPVEPNIVVAVKKSVSIASTIDTDEGEDEIDSLLNLEVIVFHDEDGEYDRHCCGAVSLPAYIAA